MIRSSVNLLFFIVRLPSREQTNLKPGNFQGSRSARILSAAGCGRWDTASSRQGHAIMPRLPKRSKILKKLPGKAGANRRTGSRPTANTQTDRALSTSLFSCTNTLDLDCTLNLLSYLTTLSDFRPYKCSQSVKTRRQYQC